MSDSIHSVSCPQARRTVSRRKEQNSWRRDPLWKQMLSEHAHVPGAICVHCKMKHGQQRHNMNGDPSIKKDGKPILVILTINHKTRDLYANKTRYLTWHQEKMEVCCTLCNKMYESGMKPCPECLNPEKGQVRYIKWYDTECSPCFYRKNPEELRKKEEGEFEFRQVVKNYNKTRAIRQRAAKVKHPCKSHRIGGKCGLSPIGSMCPYSPTKAEKRCELFVIKKSAEVKRK